MITKIKKNAATEENTKIFLGETTREKTSQNFLSIELNSTRAVSNPDNCLSLLSGALVLLTRK